MLLAASNSWIDLNALWKIIVIGLLCGAGLPMLFAIGLRALSLPARGATAAPAPEDEHIYFGNSRGAIIAAGCFAVVLAAIGWGIYFIVSG